MRLLNLFAMACFLGLRGLAFAQDLVPIQLSPIAFNEGLLTVVSPDGTEVVYTPDSLEALPTYQLVTKTPWRSEPTVFEGVLFSDVLVASGLEREKGVLVTAENDYQVTLERSVWSEAPFLLATRVNGEAHTRRGLGPIQVVLAEDVLLEPGGAKLRHLVWMAERIEPTGSDRVE